MPILLRIGTKYRFLKILLLRNLRCTTDCGPTSDFLIEIWHAIKFGHGHPFPMVSTGTTKRALSYCKRGINGNKKFL